MIERHRRRVVPSAGGRLSDVQRGGSTGSVRLCAAPRRRLCRWHLVTAPTPALIKADVVRDLGREPKNNPRFVVTNLKHSLRHVYEVNYRARTNVENRIMELHHGREIGVRFQSSLRRVVPRPRAVSL